MSRRRLFCPWIPVVATGLFAVVLSGCVNLEPETVPVRTYKLSPVLEEPLPAAADSSLALYVRRVDLPGYLQTRRILAETRDNRIDSSPYAVWAEPFGEGIARVVALNLGQAFGSEQLGYYPWRPSDPEAYFIRIQVVRLDLPEGGDLEMAARWSVTRGADGAKVAGGTFVDSRQPARDAIGSRIDALNQLLGNLAADIAAAHGEGD
ncbi:MAG: PqiC family protein [Opitutales bacterium]